MALITKKQVVMLWNGTKARNFSLSGPCYKTIAAVRLNSSSVLYSLEYSTCVLRYALIASRHGQLYLLPTFTALSFVTVFHSLLLFTASSFHVRARTNFLAETRKETRVTRFGKILHICTILNVFGAIFEALISILQKIKHALASVCLNFG